MTDEPYVALQTVMMPRDANPQGTIFGGVILGLIDMAAYIGSKRLVIQAGGGVPVLVTVAINRVEFLAPVFVGDVVRFLTTVEKLGRTSITMRVKVEVERGAEVHQVTEAELVYVAIDDESRPTPLLPS